MNSKWEARKFLVMQAASDFRCALKELPSGTARSMEVSLQRTFLLRQQPSFK